MLSKYNNNNILIVLNLNEGLIYYIDKDDENIILLEGYEEINIDGNTEIFCKKYNEEYFCLSDKSILIYETLNDNYIISGKKYYYIFSNNFEYKNKFLKKDFLFKNGIFYKKRLLLKNIIINY